MATCTGSSSSTPISFRAAMKLALTFSDSEGKESDVSGGDGVIRIGFCSHSILCFH